MLFPGKYLIALAFLVVFSACNKLEYSPNQIFDKNTPQNLNAKNIKQLLQAAADDTVKFILSGDTQRSYENSADFVKKANSLKDIDFVILNGDISDFGLLQEMEWIHQFYSKLNVPYIAVIGNHDLQSNGEKVFERMFGDLNYSFIYNGIKFICHNTNSREVGFNGTVPDLNWIDKEINSQDGVKAIVTVSHISPFSIDFDKNLEDDYVSTLRKANNLIASLHAHDHKTGVYYPYEKLCPFFITNAIVKREFLVLEIINGNLKMQEVSY